MFRNWLYIFLLLCLPLMIGCWDVEEVNRRASINAVFFDVGNPKRIKMGGSFHIPGSMLPPISGQSQQFNKRNYTLTGEGDGVLGAWARIQANAARTVFFGQLRAIVISDEFARHNMNNMLDFIGRIPLVPPNTTMLVTDTDPEKLFDIQEENNFLPGNYIDLYFQSPYKRTFSLPINLWQVNEIIDNNAHDLYMPQIKIKQSQYNISGTALFSGARMVGEIDCEETQVLAMLKGLSSGFITIPLEEESWVGFNEVYANTKIQPTIDSKGILNYKVVVDTGGAAVETNPHRVLTLKDKKIIEQKAEVYIKDKVEKLLAKLQVLNSDPVGFGEKFRVEYPERWQQINWHDIYPTARFNIKVNFAVKRTGLFN